MEKKEADKHGSESSFDATEIKLITLRCSRVPQGSAPEEAGETRGEFSQSKGHLCLSEIVCSGTWHQYFGLGEEWMQQDHS